MSVEAPKQSGRFHAALTVLLGVVIVIQAVMALELISIASDAKKSTDAQESQQALLTDIRYQVTKAAFDSCESIVLHENAIVSGPDTVGTGFVASTIKLAILGRCGNSPVAPAAP